METRSLLFGITGFILGGLLVSIAATTFDKPTDKNSNHSSSMTMQDMTASLNGKTGDEYDKSFIAAMIEHHQGAIDMAKLSENNAKHDEIKKLSRDIISAQEKEIGEMKKWEADWGYNPSHKDDSTHMNGIH